MKLLLSTLFIMTILICTYGQINFLEEGNSYLNNGELEKAEQTFKAGIKAEPDNLIYQCQLGLTQIQQKEFKVAEKTLEKVLKTDSNNVAAVWNSGIGNYKGGKD